MVVGERRDARREEVEDDDGESGEGGDGVTEI